MVFLQTVTTFVHNKHKAIKVIRFNPACTSLLASSLLADYQKGGGLAHFLVIKCNEINCKAISSVLET